MPATPHPDRRSVVLGLAASALALPAQAGVDLVAAYPDVLKFEVTRNGSPLGVVMERFGGDGRDAVAEVFIDFKVELAMLTLYRYEHRARERWRDGRLVALDSVTNDDGTPYAVTARAGAAGLRVAGDQGELTAPPDILPSSYWHPRFVEQSRMLDSQRGGVLEFAMTEVGPETVTALGRPTACTRYAMRGDIDLDIWYDRQRVWQKMAFTIGGGRVEYTRVAPGPRDAVGFATPLRDGRAIRRA